MLNSRRVQIGRDRGRKIDSAGIGDGSCSGSVQGDGGARSVPGIVQGILC